MGLTMVLDTQNKHQDYTDPKSIMFLLCQARTLDPHFLNRRVLRPAPEAVGIVAPQVVQDLFQSLWCLSVMRRGVSPEPEGLVGAMRVARVLHTIVQTEK